MILCYPILVYTIIYRYYTTENLTVLPLIHDSVNLCIGPDDVGAGLIRSISSRVLVEAVVAMTIEKLPETRFQGLGFRVITKDLTATSAFQRVPLAKPHA